MTKPSVPVRKLLGLLLSGSYTPLDLREFAQVCYALALPLIRKKIALGRLNLDTVGLKEPDVVYDCLADLFRRDQKGELSEIRTFLEKRFGNVSDCSEEEMIVALRRLIFSKVNNNIIRLYSEIDPTLGKIIRNLKLALERTRLFDQVGRFGEAYLIPREVNPLWHLPPMPFEFLQQEFSRVALIHDSVPVMTRKLHGVVTEQETFQRALPLILAALLFKELYTLGWGEEEGVTNVFEQKVEEEEIMKIVERVCNELHKEMYESYVGNGKRGEDLYGKYMLALRDILLGSLNHGPDGAAYYDCLRAHVPELTKEAYRAEHRAVIEYLAKRAKQRIREEMKKI